MFAVRWESEKVLGTNYVVKGPDSIWAEAVDLWASNLEDDLSYLSDEKRRQIETHPVYGRLLELAAGCTQWIAQEAFQSRRDLRAVGSIDEDGECEVSLRLVGEPRTFFLIRASIARATGTVFDEEGIVLEF